MQFGNDATPVILRPGDIDADATAATVRVPRLATSGKIKVTQPNGKSFESGEYVVQTFRNTDGFRFRNYLSHVSFSDMTDTFGEGETYIHIPLCLVDCTVRVRDPLAMLLVPIANQFLNGGSGGHCFGFSTVATRLLSGTYSLSRYQPGATSTWALPGGGPADASPAPRAPDPLGHDIDRAATPCSSRSTAPTTWR